MSQTTLTSPETRSFFPWWRLLLSLYIWGELTMLVSTLCIRPYQFYFYCIFLYCTSSFSSITLLSKQKTTSLSPIAFHWSAPSSTPFSSTSNHSSLWGEKSQLLSTAYTTCHLLLLSPGTLWSLTCWVLFSPACSEHMEFYPLHTPGPVLGEPCSSFQTFQFIWKPLCEGLTNRPKQLAPPACVPTTWTRTLFSNRLQLPRSHACLPHSLLRPSPRAKTVLWFQEIINIFLLK